MRFSCKGIRIAARRPPGSGTEGMGAGNSRIMSVGQFSMMGHIIKLLSTSRPRKRDIVIPERDLIFLGHSGSHLDDGRGPERSVEELLFSTPGYLNRHPGRF